MTAFFGSSASSGSRCGLAINFFAFSRKLSILTNSPRTSSWFWALTNTEYTFRLLTLVSSGGSSDHGGSFTSTPLSSAMVVVTRKKISRRNAMSAMELALISLDIRPLLVLFLMTLLFEKIPHLGYNEGNRCQNGQDYPCPK